MEKLKSKRNEETREKKLSSIGKQGKRTKFYLYKNNTYHTLYLQNFNDSNAILI